MLALIWAQAENGIIGKDGKMPWHLPNDLQHFKKLTQNNAVVMGRKTFDSMDQRPLPNRMNVVMTNNRDFQNDAIQIIHDRNDVFDIEKSFDGTIFIIGGSQIYKEFLDDADILYRTVLHQNFNGDTSFPEVDFTKWILVDKISGELDEKNTISHTFEKYIRVDS